MLKCNLNLLFFTEWLFTMRSSLFLQISTHGLTATLLSKTLKFNFNCYFNLKITKVTRDYIKQSCTEYQASYAIIRAKFFLSYSKIYFTCFYYSLITFSLKMAYRYPKRVAITTVVINAVFVTDRILWQSVILHIKGKSRYVLVYCTSGRYSCLHTNIS